jgi:nucleotide-binding universal stress UspA family protein
MYHSILVPLDGSREAEWALPTATSIARATDARLELITVDIRLPIVSFALSTQAPSPDTEHTSFTAYLHGVEERINQSGVPAVRSAVSTASEVRLASIGREISRYAEEINAGLIVLTTHGRSGVRRVVMGSVAEDVVRSCHTPVLLVKPQTGAPPRSEEPLLFRHVLVPLDASPFSEEVLTDAIELGQLGDADYTLLNVLRPPILYALPIEPWLLPIDEATLNVEQSGMAAYLIRIADRLVTRRFRARPALILGSDVTGAILHYVRQTKVDLVAMTTHGRGGLSRMLMGSVARQLVRESPVPVLLFRPR